MLFAETILICEVYSTIIQAMAMATDKAGAATTTAAAVAGRTGRASTSPEPLQASTRSYAICI